MQELLFLAHRIPYPPDKGDKIRSWHFLKGLAETYRVHLGCFIDDKRDWEFTDFLRGVCAETCFVPLSPRLARLRSLSGLLDGVPLTLKFYSNQRLHRWVSEILKRPNLSHAFIYCSAMAQYIPMGTRRSLTCIADAVDVDSEKWIEYGQAKQLPAAWIYQREGKRLRDVERQIAASFSGTIVATEAEKTLYRSFTADPADKIQAVPNGVDSEYFSPERSYPIPEKMSGTSLVFTGAMDYWPNVEAVIHFAEQILPRVRQSQPDARFFIVGSNPARPIMQLHNDNDIIVTGRVPDVRPYTAHASAIVVPLRIARGVQNKVLEGMAMAKPVIASPEAMVGIDAERDEEVLVPATPDAFADTVLLVTCGGFKPYLGQKARLRILRDYSWSASLRRLEAVMAGSHSSHMAAERLPHVKVAS